MRLRARYDLAIRARPVLSSPALGFIRQWREFEIIDGTQTDGPPPPQWAELKSGRYVQTISEAGTRRVDEVV